MPQFMDELSDKDSETLEHNNKPGILTIIVLLLLLLAMLASLIWPLLYRPVMRHRLPTPTSPFLQEA